MTSALHYREFARYLHLQIALASVAMVVVVLLGYIRYGYALAGYTAALLVARTVMIIAPAPDWEPTAGGEA